jgi:hypothetical protein
MDRKSVDMEVSACVATQTQDLSSLYRASLDQFRQTDDTTNVSDLPAPGLGTIFASTGIALAVVALCYVALHA